MNLTPNDRLKLEGALKDMSASMARQDAERDMQKNSPKNAAIVLASAITSVAFWAL